MLVKQKSNSLVLLSVGVCFLLVFLIPTDVISSSVIVARFAKAISAIVPSIKYWVRVSSFPELTGAYLAILWSVTPVMIFIHTTLIDRGYEIQRNVSKSDNRIKHQRITTPKWILTLAGLGFFGIMVLIPFVGLPTTDADLKAGTFGAFLFSAPAHSRLWLGLLGTVDCWLFSAGVALTLSFVKNNFSTSSRKRRH